MSDEQIGRWLQVLAKVTHIARDPDDNEGFTTDCFEAFCKHYGYDFPPHPTYKWSAEKLWNETPGEAWRAAWSAGVDFPLNPATVRRILEAYLILHGALQDAVEHTTCNLDNMQFYFDEQAIPTVDEVNQVAISDSESRLALAAADAKLRDISK